MHLPTVAGTSSRTDKLIKRGGEEGDSTGGVREGVGWGGVEERFKASKKLRNCAKNQLKTLLRNYILRRIISFFVT